MKSKHLILFAAISLTISSVETMADLVTNGDFETGDLTGWTWTPTEYAEPEMNPRVVFCDLTSPGRPSMCFTVNPGTDADHSGNQLEGGILWQTIDLVGGTEYEVSFNAGITKLTLVNQSRGRIQLYIEGELQWSWAPGYTAGSGTVYNSYQGTYLPTSSRPHDFELVFEHVWRNYNSPYYFVSHYVDNVAVVPEPVTLLLLGFGSVGLLRKRKRQSLNQSP